MNESSFHVQWNSQLLPVAACYFKAQATTHLDKFLSTDVQVTGTGAWFKALKQDVMILRLKTLSNVKKITK